MSATAQTIQSSVEQNRPDLAAIKNRMKATWEDGDYAKFATYMQPGAIEILNGWQIPEHSHLLDVGCGSGQTAIPAALSGMQVTGIDIATNLIDYARERARFDEIDARFDIGDAADLPYDDAQFDVVISLIGAMFAPQYQQVAKELARVCRPGGRLHMANWTPDGFAAAMFRCITKYTPPPAGIPSPVLWGVEEIVIERLGKNFTHFELVRKHYPLWKYPFGVAELVEYFRQNFGPVKRAFDSVSPAQQRLLRAELEDIYLTHNIATDGTTEIKGEYLDISARRKN
jgi:2-polyprenyl-3-methyl-5-hydroxy-6-metoxy-1,4-benzoquinol methylase